MKRLLLFGLLVTNLPAANGQVNTTIEQQLEVLAEADEAELEDDQFLQQLQQYKRHPLNINSAGVAELAQLKMLNPLQISSLLRYRTLLGPLLHLLELQAVPAWDVETIKKLLPFITVAEPVELRNELKTRLKGGDHIFLLRNSRVLQGAATGYPGSNDHLLFRYKYLFKNELQFGLTADKDAGERLFRGAQKGGFDFYSVHFFARNLGPIKSLALGDFTVNLGQGLMQWQSLAFKKGADVLNIKRQGAVLQPYSAAGEAAFNRGAGLTLQKGAWQATGFASLKNISANLVADTVSGGTHFSSILLSGLHRTPAELLDRKSVQHLFFGGAVSYSSRAVTIGFNAVSHHFSKNLQKRAEPYNALAASGKEFSSASVDYSVTHKNAHFFGEAALSEGGSGAFVSGLLVAVDPKVDFSVLYRNVAPHYNAINGNAFTENSLPTNEKGFYTGLSIRPKKGFRIDAYADHYHFPFIKYRVDAPSGGKDYLLQVSYQPNKIVETCVRFKSENKPVNETFSEAVIHPIGAALRQTLRFHFLYRFLPNFTLKARTDAVWYRARETGLEKGFLAYTEGSANLIEKTSFNVRLQYFNTDSYNSRLYAYESDVLYGYSIPPFFGKGFRYFLNASYTAGKRCTFWMKWGHTVATQEGKNKSEIKIQLRYLFTKEV